MTLTTRSELSLMTRFDKMEFLKETCNEEIINQNFLNEMVSWMGEDDFSKFYDHFCRCWDICQSYEELNEKYGE